MKKWLLAAALMSLFLAACGGADPAPAASHASAAVEGAASQATAAVEGAASQATAAVEAAASAAK